MIRSHSLSNAASNEGTGRQVHVVLPVLHDIGGWMVVKVFDTPCRIKTGREMAFAGGEDPLITALADVAGLVDKVFVF